MIHKEVKEYSNRQRINLNKKDGLSKGDKIVILTQKEYQEIQLELTNLKDTINAKDKQLELYDGQEQNLKEIIENITTPIYENHKKELENREVKINELEEQLNQLKKIYVQYNMDMTALNLWDILVFRKHKKLINDFNNSFWVTGENKVIDTSKEK